MSKPYGVQCEHPGCHKWANVLTRICWYHITFMEEREMTKCNECDHEWDDMGKCPACGHYNKPPVMK